MASKRFSILGLSLLAILVFANLVSATLSISSSPAILTKVGDSTTFTITSPSPVNLTLSSSSLIIKDNNNKEVSLQIIPPANLTNVSTATFTVNVLSVNPDFEIGSYKNSLTISASDATSISPQLTFENNAFCKWKGNTPDQEDDLTVNIKDFTVTNGFGEDKEFYLMDEVEVNVRVKNSINEDVDNIVLEWGLFNKKQESGQLV